MYQVQEYDAYQLEVRAEEGLVYCMHQDARICKPPEHKEYIVARNQRPMVNNLVFPYCGPPLMELSVHEWLLNLILLALQQIY